MKDKDHKKTLAKYTLYTKPDSGNSSHGGWSKEGRMRFYQLKVKIEEARNQRGIAEDEMQSVHRLYKQAGLEAKQPKKKKEPTVPKIDLSDCALAFAKIDADEAQDVEIDVSDSEDEGEEEHGNKGAKKSDDDASEEEEEPKPSNEEVEDDDDVTVGASEDD